MNATLPHPHRWLVRSLIGVATVLGIVAIFAVWANRQLLDTKYWTTTNTKLIESPPIREAVSVYLTEQLYANVDVSGELGKELPSELQPLAAPVAGALKDVVQKGINLLLERPRVQELWSKANQITHAQFVRLIENKGSVIKLPGGGAVVLDLRPMLGEVAQKVGAPTSIVNKIPPKVAQLRIVTSKQLDTMQKAVNLLRSLALVLPLLVFALFALAVYLARGRRRQTLIAVGAAFIGAGLVVVVLRGVIGSKVVELAGHHRSDPARRAGGVVDRHERALGYRLVDGAARNPPDPRRPARRTLARGDPYARAAGPLPARPSGHHLRRAGRAALAAVRVGPDRGHENVHRDPDHHRAGRVRHPGAPARDRQGVPRFTYKRLPGEHWPGCALARRRLHTGHPTNLAIKARGA